MTPELYQSRFLKACRREETDTTPIWIMRQAGRYLPEYRRVREGLGFLEFCKRPDLAAQVTLEAQQILDVDAAILFADLPTILEPMGFSLSYDPGPQIGNPFRQRDDLDRIRAVEDIGEMGYVFETVERVRKDLPANIPLIGFCGAPFTLASYAIEGAGSKNYVFTKQLMYREPDVWNEFLARLVESLARLVNRQVESGCQAIQIFDSWAGCLSPSDYERYAMPHTKRLIESLPGDVPVINFLTGNPALIPLQAQAGGDVIGLDWRVNLKAGWKTAGEDRAVQGNLDPVVLFSGLDTIRREAENVLSAAEGRPGHIFNLGHGVMPEMNPDHVKALVDIVHETGSR